MSNKHIKKELINQVTKWTGRKPYPHELIVAWYEMRDMSKEELLGALVEINEMLYARNRFLSR